MKWTWKRTVLAGILCGSLLVGNMGVADAGCRSYPTYTYPVYVDRVIEKILVKEILVATPVIVPTTFFQVVQASSPTLVSVAAPAVVAAAPVTSTVAVGTVPVAAMPAAAAGCPPAVEARLARIEAALLRLLSQSPAYNTGANNGDGFPSATEDGTGTSWAQPQANLYYAAGVLAKNCAACHTGDGGRGGIRLFNGRGEFDPNVSGAEILASVTPRGNQPPRMPKDGKPLEKADVDLLRTLSSR